MGTLSSKDLFQANSNGSTPLARMFEATLQTDDINSEFLEDVS